MEKRSYVKMAILTVVTLGIYQLFWLYRTKKELVDHGKDVPPFKLLLSPIFAILLIAALQFITHFAFQATGDSSPAMKAVNIISVLVGVTALLASFPITIYWYYKYCKAAESITNGELSFTLSFSLILIFSFIGISFIWPFIVQSYYNRLSDTSGLGMPPRAPTPQPL